MNLELEKIMKERYSVRSFTDQKIEKEKLEELLKVLNMIPTAANAQPVRVYVLESKEALEKVGKFARTYQAQVVLLITADTDKVWKNPIEKEYNTSEMDGSIACTYFMLKAWELGIGSVWIRYFNSLELKEAFQLPEHIQPICLLALGYPSADSTPTFRHNEKQSLENLITYL